MKQELINFLEYKAFKLRYLSIISTTQAGSGHPTSCLSAADIMAALFFYAMKYDPQNFNNPNNDRFILSKGHAAPILYAAWQEVGVISEEDMLTLRKIDSVLEGHPTTRFKYVEAATGSLGQGLSIGAGIALSAKLDKRDFFTYVLLGDAESTEGQIWEAAELSYYYKLDNLVAILDVNRLGQTGSTIEGYNVTRHEKKFKAFGWQTITINGHNMKEIVKAYDQVRKEKDGKPKIIIAKTIKGYGVESVEDKNGYHGKAFERKNLSNILKKLHEKFSKAAKYDEKYKWKPNLPKKEKPIILPKKFKIPKPKYKIGEEYKTRLIYGEALAALAEVCPQLLSLDAEVKNSTYAEILEKKDPDKFIQCFVAEQNMISMSVGLLSRGKIVFSSTFACFMTRAFDQIRMAAIGRSPLRLSGSHSGVSIGEDGPSQMGLEDIAMMRSVFDSVVLYPCDAVSTYKLVEQMANRNDGITYIRTTRPKTPVIYKNDEEFHIGGCKVIKESSKDKALIIGAGVTLHEALKAYEMLKKENILVAIIDLYCIKPLDKETLAKVAKKSGKKIVTVEDHYLDGGLGQAVCYELRNEDILIESLAVTKMPRSGKPQELFEYEGIDAKSIIKIVKKLVK